MKPLSVLRHSERTMRRKLFGYMLSLAVVLLATLLTALLLFGRFSSTRQQTASSLELQMEVLARDVDSAFEETAVLGILLSNEMSRQLEETLSRLDLDFARLSDNPQALTAIQEDMISPLQQILLQSGCSGAFVLLDATVNTQAPEARFSHSGLYLQRSEVLSPQPNVILYRGIPEVGKARSIMPHRKWRLEFRSDLFPSYEELIAPPLSPPEEAYRLTSVFTLPGTSERATLLSLPLVSDSGQFYGLCGFEISQSCFQASMAQPTKFSYLTGLLAASSDGTLPADSGLSCGVDGGYFLAPRGNLSAEAIGSGLYRLQGGALPYIGVLRQISLTPNNDPYLLAVMTPKAEYDQLVFHSTLQVLVLVLLLLFFTISCCIYFSRKFLAPVLRSIEQMKSSQPQNTSSGFQEIDDLFGFLLEKDQEHESALQALKAEKATAQDRAQKMQIAYQQSQNRYETVQSELARLAYTRGQEVDPDEYRLFLEGIDRLTPTEKDIFGYYLEGHTVREIMEIAGIKESTLRYHNRNIYSKLGVNSLKQLLRYATLMQWQEKNKT